MESGQRASTLFPASEAVSGFEDVAALTREDMDGVNRRIRENLDSDIALINTLADYLISSGGKRLRPMVVVLAARACGYRGDHHTTLAAVIEFIHSATLLHDDVVDESAMRRGKATANEVWGNASSVLVGDFLYSRAFEMMVSVDNMQVMDLMARTTNAIAEGEVLQLLNCGSPEVTEAQYFETIRRKTACLFQSAAELGAIVTGADARVRGSLSGFGEALGMAFQLVDDVLDYRGDSTELGKNVGDDLAEGKPTLPLIHALANAPEAGRQVIAAAIENGDADGIDRILPIIESAGSLAYTSALARRYSDDAQAALAGIPDSPYKEALSVLAEFSVARSY